MIDPSPDELAGVADLFGGLTAEELVHAFRDLAAREGEPFDAAAIHDSLERATAGFYLIEVEHDGEDVYAPGPAALPELPDQGPNPPHLMDVEPRRIDRDTIARAAERRLRAEAATAVAEAELDRVEALLDVCYEVDAWGVDTATLRDRLEVALD